MKYEKKNQVNEVPVPAEIRKPLESTIISQAMDQVKVTSLIDSNKSYSLLYRGSRDGFDAESFHTSCDN